MQFFRCGYTNAVSDWPGWRAVVTPLAPPAASAAGAARAPAGAAGLAPAEGRRFWVDLPGSGAPTFLKVCVYTARLYALYAW